MMKPPRSPQVVTPYSRTFSFYVALGTLSALLWVLASITNGSGLATLPKLVTFREMRNIVSSYNSYTPLSPRQSREQPLHFQSAQDIVDALNAATARAAAGGAPPLEFGEREEQQWRRENACRSRAELALKYAGRKIARDIAPNAKWNEVFSAYMAMHRACLSAIGSVDAYFLSRNRSTGCKFLVSQVPKVGLGNRVLSRASALLVAVLTQRVLLIPDAPGADTQLFCEPFVGSSWRLNSASALLSEHASPWQHTAREFQLWVDESECCRQRTDPRHHLNLNLNLNYYAVTLSRFYQPIFRFYCNTEQAYMAKVPWIEFGGCLYILPKLFAIAAFRPALEDMFPERMALTHILRSAFLPSDAVWERVASVAELYMAHTRSLVGVQLRYFGGRAQYRRMNDVINRRVLRCATEHGLLPEARPVKVDERSSVDGAIRGRNTSKVFIASLFPGLRDFLGELYLRRRSAASGDAVGVVQLTHESEQRFGTEVDVEALVEIVCLSLADSLFVTPVSTFGGLAQAYGALRPWFIAFDEFAADEEDDDRGGPACERAQSVDVCFDQASERFICPHDPQFDGVSIVDSVPYIEKCLRRDSPGVQLITTHESNPVILV